MKPNVSSTTQARPRVLIFHTHAGNAGTEEISRLLDAELSARGYEVHVLSFIRATNFPSSAPNAIAYAFPPELGPLGYARMAMLAFTEIRRLRPEVLLCMQWGGNMLGAFAAPFAGSPVVIANQFTPMLMVPALARWIDRLQGTLGAFSRIVVNSRAVEKGYAAYPSRYRERLVRIEHGFREKTSALSKAEARRTFGLPQDAPLLGSVGRLSLQKHFDAAVRLLACNASWNVALGGHGEERDRLHALATSLGCADRLHLPGEIHADRVGDFLAALDVFVFPSIAETFGLAVVEAAQAAVPIVANNLPVLREVLNVDGEPCALFVDVDDTRAFAEAVSHLISDEALCARLTRVGQGLRHRFPLEEMYDAYDRLIKEALRET